MTKRAGSRPPRVSLASPVTQPPSVRHSARISGPPARWMAPSTPPPASGRRVSRLRQSHAGVAARLHEMARTLWDEAWLLLERLVDLVWTAAPRLLTGPARAAR